MYRGIPVNRQTPGESSSLSICQELATQLELEKSREELQVRR